MLPKRWHHGHSLVAGALVGLGVTYRPWLVFAAGLACGALLVVALYGGYRLTVELRSAWRSWHRSSSRKRSRPIRETVDATDALSKAEGVPW